MKSLVALFTFAGLLINSPIQADAVQELHLEIKLELMAFGIGVAEGVQGLGKLSPGGYYKSEYTDVPDSPIITESVPGLQVARVQVVDGKLLLKRLTVTKADLRTPVGEFRSISRASLQQNIGSPDEIIGDSYIYSIPSHIGSDDLKFSFHNDVLQSIEWVWNFD